METQSSNNSSSNMSNNSTQSNSSVTKQSSLNVEDANRNNHNSNNNNCGNEDDINDFVRKGRTGRRNAVADFNLDPNLNTMSTTMLADLMCKSMLHQDEELNKSST